MIRVKDKKRVQAVVDLHSMFECKQHIKTLLLAQIAQGDAAIEIPKLSSPNGVWCIHLGHYPVRRLPSLGGSALHQGQTQMQYENVCVAFYLVRQLMLKLLYEKQR